MQLRQALAFGKLHGWTGRHDHWVSTRQAHASRVRPAEEEHFYKCPACGGLVDCRELGQVFDHEGPLPHPADDWRQRALVAP